MSPGAQEQDRLAVTTRPVTPDEAPAAPVEDIRSARPYVFSRKTLAAVVRRLLSVAVLVTIDLVGLICGLYVALIFRELYLGQWPPLWGILWKTETDWLPFLTVITVLVFWVGGGCARRAGGARRGNPPPPPPNPGE